MVIGTHYFPELGEAHASRFEDGVFEALLPPGAVSSSARVANAAGQFVGTAYGASSTAPFVYDGSSFVTLGPPVGYDHASASDIGADGVVVGHCFRDEAPESIAVRWVDGAPEALPALPGALGSGASAVNGAGTILGEVRVFTGLPEWGVESWVDVLWSGDEPVELGRLVRWQDRGRLRRAATLINDAGQLAGITSKPSASSWPPQFFATLLTPIEPRPGDIDGDCITDHVDLDILLYEWMRGAGPGSAADVDGDGAVGGGDVAVILGDWGG